MKIALRPLKIKLSFIMFIPLILLSIVSYNGHSDAATGNCYFGTGACDVANIACGTDNGPTTKGNDMFIGRNSSCAPNPDFAIPRSGPNAVNSKVSLANFILNKMNNGTGREKTAAAFVINEALGTGTGRYTSNARTRAPTNQMKTDFYNMMTSPKYDFYYDGNALIDKTSFYNVDKNDVFYDRYSAVRPVVGLVIAGLVPSLLNTKFVIEVTCGNLAMDPATIINTVDLRPEGLVWNNATPNDKLHDITAAPGETVTFMNTLVISNANNTLTDTFRYKVWDVNGNLPAAADYTPNPVDVQYVNGQKVPDPQNVYFVFPIPTNAPIGEVYCRQTLIDVTTLESYVTKDQAQRRGCVTVGTTKITPKTTGSPNPISVGQQTNFKHEVITAPYSNLTGPRNYVWSVWIKEVTDPDLVNLPTGFCANEWAAAGVNGYCGFSGTRDVRYGANGTFVVRTLTNGTSCSNGVFGDPLPGVEKACYLLPAGTSNITNYTKIAGYTQATTNANGSVTVFNDPRVGKAGVVQICEKLVLEHVNPSSPDNKLTIITESEDCVTVAGAVDRNVLMQANSGGQINIQPEEKAVGGRLWSTVNGSTTPDKAAKEWGYNHDATPATATIVPEGEDKRSPDPKAQRDDPRSNPAVSKELCNTNIAGCPKFNPAQNGWFCGSTNVGDADTDPNPGCPYTVSQHQWKCPDPAQPQTGWMDDPSQPTCNSLYDPNICADGRTAKYWAAPGGINCPDTWNCLMQGIMLPSGRGQPICEYRCEQGTGARAPLSTPSTLPSANGQIWNVHAGTDIHCYKQWSFQIRCSYSYIGNWRYFPPANNNNSELVTVTPNTDFNNICVNNYDYYGGMVSDNPCVEILAIPVMQGTGTYFLDNSGGILGRGDTLYPGKIGNTQPKRWGVVSNPSRAQQCFLTIAKPYITFDRTDIRALLPGGTGRIDTVGYGTGTTYYGSSVGYAAFATSTITGLKTYKYGDSSQNRAFSNDGYNDSSNRGGLFGNSLSKTVASLTTSMINGPTTCVNNLNNLDSYTSVTVIYCGGSDITITNNKTTEWRINSPNSVYVIANNINITNNVTSLKGVALIADTINTCSDGAAGCGNSLEILGAVVANDIKFRRAANNSFGSSVYCVRPTREADLANVPGLPRTCDTYAKTAETINYSPEFSLSSPPFQPTSGIKAGQYDSIRSLPPIY